MYGRIKFKSLPNRSIEANFVGFAPDEIEKKAPNGTENNTLLLFK